MGDVYAYYVPFPGKIKGLTVLKEGDYIVFINEALSDEERKKALGHETRHINYKHLYDDCIPILACEKEAIDGKKK